MFRAIGEFLTFRRMIGPIVLQLLFWGAVVMLVMFGPAEVGSSDPVINWAVVILLILGLRIAFELMLLAFRMYDRLGQIRNLLQAVDDATKPIAVIEDKPET